MLLLFIAVFPILGILASRSRGESAKCASLKHLGRRIIPGYPSEIYASEWYPDNTTFTSGSVTVPNLASFCRFGAYFNTSETTKVQFEIWLPTKKNWNGRFGFAGNGGTAGNVVYLEMGVPLSKYGFAIASTNTGHDGSPFDAKFAINNPDTLYDFGFRAVHLSTIFAKNVMERYYRVHENSYKSYWLGCSSGGKQGLREVTMFPEDYDGVMSGAPAWWWSHLSVWLIQVGLLNPPSAEGYIDSNTWLSIHSSIVSQCDGDDGLVDGLITDPTQCQPDFTQMNLSGAQQEVARSLYSDLTWPSGYEGRTEGDLIYPAFSYGFEYSGAPYVVSPFPAAPEYFLYQVLNLTEITTDHVFTISELLDLLQVADQTNPGLTTVDDYNIQPFIDRGGKLLTYTGMADELIPTGGTIYHHSKVVETLGYDPRDSFRLFTVPGMGHCYSGGFGRSPRNFGSANQFDISLGGISQGSQFDKDHDMILSLIDWTENGVAPDSIIGSSWVNDTMALGVDLQRPICPWPEIAQYDGMGDPDKASSFACA